jgi:uncharacterized protein YcfL
MKKLITLLFAIAIMTLISCNSSTTKETLNVDSTLVNKDSVSLKVDSTAKVDTTKKEASVEVKK